eukprot:TRINITY_DN8526_c0_g2_i1.p1 TRINITY_DN8526_c0_g2~~TRINITY_DN8526_c0_g2_i1.p1  ORF type:complete len:631 (+),score=157.75 TRINITY_DN8526_c0_g2_i1:48-1940(+)
MPGGVGIITQEEWIAERGLAPSAATHGFLDCTAYAEELATVPGQSMGHVPHVWVSLVECLGIMLGIEPMTHPAWEQTYSIRAQSRYYPTMELLRLHNVTTLHRIAKVTSLTVEQQGAVVPYFCELRERPGGGGADLLSSAYVGSVCGAAAQRLCEHVESVLFGALEPKTIVMRCRYYQDKERENASLAVIKDSLDTLKEADAALGAAERQLVPKQCMQDAASYSLQDVVIKMGATSALPTDDAFQLRGMFREEWRKEMAKYVRCSDLGHLVAIAVLQLVAAVSLRTPFRAKQAKSEAGAPAAGRPSAADVPQHFATGNAEVSEADMAYWQGLGHLDGQDLIMALPPFDRSGPDATLGDLVDRVLDEDGRIRPEIVAYRPTYEDLDLKHDVLRCAVAAWRVRVRPLLEEWEVRKWEPHGLDTLLHDHYGQGHIHFKRPWMWVGAVLDQWEGLRDHAAASERQVAAQRQYEAAAAKRHPRPAQPKNELPPRNPNDISMTVEEAYPDDDIRGVKVVLRHPAEEKAVQLTAPRHYRSEAAAEPRRPPNAGAWRTDASGVALTNEQIAWTFRKLDRNRNGYLERDEVRRYFVTSDAASDAFGDDVVDKQLTAMVGHHRQLDLEDFKTVLLKIAKR